MGYTVSHFDHWTSETMRRRPDWPVHEIRAAVTAAILRARDGYELSHVVEACLRQPGTTPADVAGRWDEWVNTRNPTLPLRDLTTIPTDVLRDVLTTAGSMAERVKTLPETLPEIVWPILVANLAATPPPTDNVTRAWDAALAAGNWPPLPTDPERIGVLIGKPPDDLVVRLIATLGVAVEVVRDLHGEAGDVEDRLTRAMVGSEPGRWVTYAQAPHEATPGGAG